MLQRQKELENITKIARDKLKVVKKVALLNFKQTFFI